MRLAKGLPAETLLPFPDLRALAAGLAAPTLCTASDGNHGRAVAALAQALGCGCVVFLPADSAASRVDAIAGHGATVELVDGSYDEAVAAALRDVEEASWREVVPPVLVLAGSTASGKTELALDLAERYGAEIVGADSRQIYRGMPIGTAAPTERQRIWDLYIDMGLRWRNLPKPTIAAVRGWCLAGGCELAMACDLVVCTEDARFGEPEIRYGSGPVTLLMPFVLGQKKTSELLFTGDSLGAPEALAAGLVNRVVAADRLDAEVDDLVRKIAPTPLPVLRFTKLALQAAYEAMGLRQAVAANVGLSSLLNSADTPEQREFDRIAAEGGLRAALDWRDRRYGAT